MSSPTDKDACELLDADHIAVKHLFVEYACRAFAGPQKNGPDRAVLAKKICKELKVHMQIEEEIFYPAFRATQTQASARLGEAQQEHEQAKGLIAQIEPMRAADAAMDDLVSRLARAVEHHVKEERDELFPKARAAPELDLVELGHKLRARQQALEGGAREPVK
jgi:hypothetical protein